MDNWNPIYESTDTLKTIYKTNTNLIKIYKQQIADMIQYDERRMIMYKNRLQLYEERLYSSLFELIRRGENT